MSIPFRRQDIAKAFFGLDLSDTQPPLVDSNNTPTPTTTEIDLKPSFLNLPTEIRLQIYDLLLVSRFDREQNPSWAVGNTYQKTIMLHMVKDPRNRTMEPAILRTCRQILCEAIPVLYSRNVFNTSEPEQMFRFMTQIGPTNIKLVRSLDMWIPWRTSLLPWLDLLHALSNADLKHITLGWGADCDFPWMLERGAEERGLGDNLPFIRALAKIQGLEKIHLQGYYAKNWPSYLRRITKAQVQAERGQYLQPGPDDDSETIQWLQDINKRNLLSFEEYQKGTEDLVP